MSLPTRSDYADRRLRAARQPLPRRLCAPWPPMSARPVIFPLSNPTSRSEATPQDLMAWTDERAVIGTGSPFPPVMRHGKPMAVDQTNNAYIFPGVGLGVLAINARRVTDSMFMAAAKALAGSSPAARDPEDTLLPSVSRLARSRRGGCRRGGQTGAARRRCRNRSACRASARRSRDRRSGAGHHVAAGL